MPTQKWIKLGNIFIPSKNYIESTHIGPSFLKFYKKNKIKIYFTHRNKDNKSEISECIFDVKSKKIINNSFKKILSVGAKGALDENGVSYPFIIKNKKINYFFYVGWSKKKGVPFNNRLAVVKLKNKNSNRRLFIKNLSKTGSGSNFIYKIKKNNFLMFYTHFLKWIKEKKKIKHYYTIRVAHSHDLINWKSYKKNLINFNKNEFAISKPSIIKHKKKFHMWFCFRGKKYKIGYAYSKDGINWIRDDKSFNFSNKYYKWEAKEMCYPSVIKIKNQLFMVYCGKQYGKGGLGLMKMRLLNDF